MFLLLLSVITVLSASAQFACDGEPRQANTYTVILDNKSDADFTAWADGYVGVKAIKVVVGGTIKFPKIEYDNYSQSAKYGQDYYFEGWFYSDKNAVERQLTEETPFFSESLNIDGTTLRVYVKVVMVQTNNY
ncbi:MAG: hypothetical protein IJQ87_01945 [Clostridia bacterium]|nr:hypothetical protein [Clostridia bacterium]